MADIGDEIGEFMFRHLWNFGSRKVQGLISRRGFNQKTFNAAGKEVDDMADQLGKAADSCSEVDKTHASITIEDKDLAKECNEGLQGIGVNTSFDGQNIVFLIEDSDKVCDYLNKNQQFFKEHRDEVGKDFDDLDNKGLKSEQKDVDPKDKHREAHKENVKETLEKSVDKGNKVAPVAAVVSPTVNSAAKDSSVKESSAKAAKSGKDVVKPSKGAFEGGEKFKLCKDQTMEFEGRTLYRIQATKDFEVNGKQIKAGDLGGWVESDKNLSQKGNCWIDMDAKVMDKAKVRDSAVVTRKAVVKDKAVVEKQSMVAGRAKVMDNAKITDMACVFEDATVMGNALVNDVARAFGFDVADEKGIHTLAERETGSRLATEAQIRRATKAQEKAATIKNKQTPPQMR